MYFGYALAFEEGGNGQTSHESNCFVDRFLNFIFHFRECHFRLLILLLILLFRRIRSRMEVSQKTHL